MSAYGGEGRRVGVWVNGGSSGRSSLHGVVATHGTDDGREVLCSRMAHGDGGVFDALQLSGQGGHLMIMRGEQGAATVGIVQVFEGGPSDRQPIIGRCAAPDFIKDHQGAVVRLIEDGRGFDHFDHEGRPPARQIIRSTHAAEQLADQTDAGTLGRHKAAHLCQ
jgi:hypothetical protein